MTSTTLAGGELNISAGAVGDYIDIQQSGFAAVTGSGVASNVTIHAMGKMAVYGGTVTDVAVLSGGVLSVTSAGLSQGVDLKSGAMMTVQSNGEDRYAKVQGRAEEVVANGTAFHGYLEGVGGSGLATSSSISPGVGLLEVAYSGRTRSAYAYSDAEVILSGGYEDVKDGAANQTHVQSGGVLEVDLLGSARATVISSGGEMLVYQEPEKVKATVLKVGALIDLGNRVITDATISGKSLIASSGATVVETFALGGQTAGLGVTVTFDGNGGTLLTVIASTTDASQLQSAAASLVAAAPARVEAHNLQSAHAPLAAEPQGLRSSPHPLA